MLNYYGVLPHTYFAELERCSFPNLQILQLYAKFCPSLVIFLRRHSLHIRDMSISLGSLLTDRRPTFRFPALERYSGDFDLMTMFLPGSRVQCIDTFFDDKANLVSTFSVLSETTMPLDKISFFAKNFDFRVFECLSQYAPCVQAITLPVTLGWEVDMAVW
jgi:hypothetical protein